jgi:ribosomal protein S12 methylthiotransferase accessory factor
MQILLKENQKVDVLYKDFTIQTDQPVKAGGGGAAPSPFDLFLASIGACAGFYVKSFCTQRNLPQEGIEMTQHMHLDPETRMISRISIQIRVPRDFPEKYLPALVKAAEACSVKKHIASAPAFSIETIQD